MGISETKPPLATTSLWTSATAVALSARRAGSSGPGGLSHRAIGAFLGALLGVLFLVLLLACYCHNRRRRYQSNSEDESSQGHTGFTPKLAGQGPIRPRPQVPLEQSDAPVFRAPPGGPNGMGGGKMSERQPIILSERERHQLGSGGKLKKAIADEARYYVRSKRKRRRTRRLRGEEMHHVPVPRPSRSKTTDPARKPSLKRSTKK